MHDLAGAGASSSAVTGRIAVTSPVIAAAITSTSDLIGVFSALPGVIGGEPETGQISLQNADGHVSIDGRGVLAPASREGRIT